MTLKDRITQDMKTALKGGDKPRLSAVRLLLAAVKQKEVDERVALDDAGVTAVIEKLIKQRKDAMQQYANAGRMDLADAERFEADVLAAYMPAAASAEEVQAAVEAAVAEAGARGPQDMGKVMGLLKARLAGRADMSQLSARVRARLTA